MSVSPRSSAATADISTGALGRTYCLLDVTERQYAPPTVYPHFFYGFLSVTMAWHVAFLVIGSKADRRKPRRMFEPCRVVFEGRAFLVLAHAGPQPPHQVWHAVQVHVDKRLFVYHAPLVRFCFRDPRIRCGRCSSSSRRPTASCFGSARSARRSTMPITKSTVA